MSRKIKDAIAFIFIYLAAFYAVLLLAGINLYVFAKGVLFIGLAERVCGARQMGAVY